MLPKRNPKTGRWVGGEMVPAETRFWAHVNKDGPMHPYEPALGPCWLWTANTNDGGYGQITIYEGTRRTPRLAHRFSYLLHGGVLPSGALVLHSCDNRRCVNPSHLRAGSDLDNVHEMIARGRAGWQIRVWPPNPMARVRTHCLICRAELWNLPSRIKRGEGKYCSKRCAALGMTTAIARVCEACQRSFTVVRAVAKRGGGRFCSLPCRRLGMRRR